MGFLGASGFSDSLAPGPVVATVQCQGLHSVRPCSESADKIWHVHNRHFEPVGNVHKDRY